MKKLLILLLPLLVSFATFSQGKLSPDATISLITYDPSETSVYALYGHTAIRVKDPAINFDRVYNYGIFDFDESNFIYRFTKGETDYKLGVVDFRRLMEELYYRQCGAREQILNLTQGEKDKIWQALIINALPENAVYRYNFFYDNCATRPAALIEKNVEGSIVYRESSERHTYRQLINHCMRNNPWLIFGTEIALGSPTDEFISPRAEFFLPLYLEKAFDSAVIANADGTKRNLVIRKNILMDSFPEEEAEMSHLSPMLCGWIFFVIILLLTFIEKKRKFKWIDILMAFVAGMSGCLVFFLAFVSVHPATWPNFLILWLHPFHLLAIPILLVERWKKGLLAYNAANLILLILLLAIYPFITQSFNAAVFPMIFAYILRSARAAYFAFKEIRKQGKGR